MHLIGWIWRRPLYIDRVKAMDWKATFTPDDPRSHRDDVGDGSEYASKARPPQKRAVERENSPFPSYMLISELSVVSKSLVWRWGIKVGNVFERVEISRAPWDSIAVLSSAPVMVISDDGLTKLATGLVHAANENAQHKNEGFIILCSPPSVPVRKR